MLINIFVRGLVLKKRKKKDYILVISAGATKTGNISNK